MAGSGQGAERGNARVGGARVARQWAARGNARVGAMHVSARVRRGNAAIGPPRVVAGVVESAPANLPIGVRAALTRYACPFAPALWSIVRVYTGVFEAPRVATYR